MPQEQAGEGVQAHYVQIDGELIEVWTAKRVANVSDFSLRHIQRLCDEGELIAYKSGGRYWIPFSEVKKLTLMRSPF